jgi:bacteriocin-like protein
MRELTANELKAVSGGVMAITVRKEPPIVRFIEAVLRLIKCLEGRPVLRKMAA